MPTSDFATIPLSPHDPDDYFLFLKIKELPRFQFRGRSAIIPAEYLDRIGLAPPRSEEVPYEPLPGLFDYQEAIARVAIRKRKYALFMDCGIGKTNICLEFARHAMKCLAPDRKALIVSPLMVVDQTIAECGRFYGKKLRLCGVPANRLASWLTEPGERFGITNYEALNEDVPQELLGCLIGDESSSWASHYGVWGRECIRLGKGLEWKLSSTGTPAPNDRIEFANHAVFLDAFPTINSFLAKFFVNRGHTDNRWELKPHALRPFYRALGHWSIFMTNPATYGWHDNAGTLPPINVHINRVDITAVQKKLAGAKKDGFFGGYKLGGITGRSVISQIAKGNYRGQDVETLKPQFIRALVDSWPEESTIIWAWYNREQELLERTFPEAASIKGDTPHADRVRMIRDFQEGRTKIIISKSKIMGFGLNLQKCTRMIFSGLNDSYLSYWQCIKRANRVGSTRPLNVHIPITDLERPLIDTVLQKADRIQHDTEEQERLFKEVGIL